MLKPGDVAVHAWREDIMIMEILRVNDVYADVLSMDAHGTYFTCMFMVGNLYKIGVL